MGKLPEGMTNERYLRFGPEALVEGGPSMKDGLSIEQQIEKAPVDALWNPQIDWGKYKTSAYGQLAFNAQALARIEANQRADRAILQQILAATSSGASVVIDYDRIEKAIADNMPTFEITPITKEG